ncbi:dihydroneopterin aldolase [Bacteroidales bacterium OttesenSCG-928-M11]|nr:dihydroneopterin aldolase [Bacteroidales bacterium OttesenSCG-928-M11]
MQQIELKQIKFFSYHGVMEQERIIGNTYILDIELRVDITKAMESDNLEDTINYALIYELIKKEMEIPSKLLEHIAGRIIKRLKKEFPTIQNIKLRIAKQRPPIEGEIKEAAISIEI